MVSWRRAILALLLTCVPFQTVLGATGLACMGRGHHQPPAAVHAQHAQHASMPAPVAAPGCSEHADATVPGQDADPHTGTDSCRYCLDCCATVAPAVVLSAPVRGPQPFLRMTTLTSSLHASTAGDGLFRPPRT